MRFQVVDVGVVCFDLALVFLIGFALLFRFARLLRSSRLLRNSRLLRALLTVLAGAAELLQVILAALICFAVLLVIRLCDMKISLDALKVRFPFGFSRGPGGGLLRRDSVCGDAGSPYRLAVIGPADDRLFQRPVLTVWPHLSHPPVPEYIGSRMRQLVVVGIFDVCVALLVKADYGYRDSLLAAPTLAHPGGEPRVRSDRLELDKPHFAGRIIIRYHRLRDRLAFFIHLVRHVLWRFVVQLGYVDLLGRRAHNTSVIFCGRYDEGFAVLLDDRLSVGRPAEHVCGPELFLFLFAPGISPGISPIPAVPSHVHVLDGAQGSVAVTHIAAPFPVVCDYVVSLDRCATIPLTLRVAPEGGVDLDRLGIGIDKMKLDILPSSMAAPGFAGVHRNRLKFFFRRRCLFGAAIFSFRRFLFGAVALSFCLALCLFSVLRRFLSLCLFRVLRRRTILPGRLTLTSCRRRCRGMSALRGYQLL